MNKETATGMLSIFIAGIQSFISIVWNSIKTAFHTTSTPLVAAGSFLVGFGLSVLAGGTIGQIVIGGLAMAGIVQAGVFAIATVVYTGISLYHWTKTLFAKEEEPLIDTSEVRHTVNYEAREKARRAAVAAEMADLGAAVGL